MMMDGTILGHLAVQLGVAKHYFFTSSCYSCIKLLRIIGEDRHEFSGNL